MDNSVEITNRFEEITKYIRELSLLKNHELILDSNVKTDFGFLINIQSMLHMYKFTCIDNNMLKICINV